MALRPLTFLSDFGYADDFAGVCRAVIARIAPGTQIVDLTHGIRPRDIAAGAAVLERALPFAAPGVHLAVVDPGVGSERRAVAVKTAAGERILVGPDNGLLVPAIEAFGGGVEAVDIGASAFRLEPVSATFHGRDIFAPVAANLALGAALADAGEGIDPATLIAPPGSTGPRSEAGRLVAHVAHVDRFGNASLDARPADLADAGLADARSLSIRGRDRELVAAVTSTFADVEVDEFLLYENSYGHLALAMNGGAAAETLGLAPGDELGLFAP